MCGREVEHGGDTCIEIKRRTLIVSYSNHHKWHISDLKNRMYVVTQDGKKVSMPRYYKNKLYTEEQRKAVGFAARQGMLERMEKAIRSGNILTPRDQVEADKQAYSRMYNAADRGRSKI